ncbi:MAG TPA: hypothetical protein PL069_04725 [Saprospiraceae bacterium]|mgnify:CR=1 FL=1|nr:hypothetical protein [Syntrophorhabdus sp.]HQP76689.1 hypothetical protein [Saprospiraceae bacterium]
MAPEVKFSLSASIDLYIYVLIGYIRKGNGIFIKTSLINKAEMEIQPYQTPLAWVRLRWMEEYLLESLVEMYQQQKLQDCLTKKVEQAEVTIDFLMKNGRTRPMAEEAVIGEILAPPQDYQPKWPQKLKHMIPIIERSLKA